MPMIFLHLQGEVNCVKWDPTGTLLASCSDDITAKVLLSFLLIDLILIKHMYIFLGLIRLFGIILYFKQLLIIIK